MAEGSKNSDSQPNPPNGRAARAPSRQRTSPESLRPTKEGYNFPKVPLEDCVRLAQAIEEKNAGNPMPADVLVKAVGLHQPNDWRFLDLLRSSAMFGITEGTGERATVGLTQLGQDIVAPSSLHQRATALRNAFDRVETFKQVAEFYKGKPIPEDEYFGNLLVRQFGVLRDRVQRFTEVFFASLKYVQAFARTLPQGAAGRSQGEAGSGMVEVKSEPGDGGRAREFLDTCFVLMPFGDWYDVYYNDVYSPAVKDAGFEPNRADNLFHSGSVMEQIWEEIKGAKVLIAEVTGKNANVFYELGLAHSRGKPVVIVTGNLEDVPFDLRHLRVVVYDVNDPFWGTKVRGSLTTHLKNAKTDPAKSIPQPFRADTEQSGEVSNRSESAQRAKPSSATA